jgi:hypothetical protein
LQCRQPLLALGCRQRGEFAHRRLKQRQIVSLLLQ